ncbi:hypothetical protein NXX23_00305 [Bacteroides ovatus]|nr:hypothetical protein [Bacteroides ovatus]
MEYLKNVGSLKPDQDWQSKFFYILFPYILRGGHLPRKAHALPHMEFFGYGLSVHLTMNEHCYLSPIVE